MARPGRRRRPKRRAGAWLTLALAGWAGREEADPPTGWSRLGAAWWAPFGDDGPHGVRIARAVAAALDAACWPLTGAGVVALVVGRSPRRAARRLGPGRATLLAVAVASAGLLAMLAWPIADPIGGGESFDSFLELAIELWTLSIAAAAVAVWATDDPGDRVAPRDDWTERFGRWLGLFYLALAVKVGTLDAYLTLQGVGGLFRA